MEYQIGDTKTQLVAEEREHIKIEGGNQKLKVLKAVFGKFKAETKGIPENYKTFDVTKYIKNQVDSGNYNIPVTDKLIDNQIPEDDKTALKITYLTDGEERTSIIPKGQLLKLSKDSTKRKLVYTTDGMTWITNRSGTIEYINASGETKRAEVQSISEPIDLSENWKVEFPSNSEELVKEKFSDLISWSDHKNDNIQHFSGTVTYKKEFVITDDLLQPDKSLELDLGSVAVIAEVIVNGENVATLWKAPFRINISDFVTTGNNTLEVKVTNLWPNKLIGDESFPLDFERKGNKLKSLPDWLVNNTTRPSKRSTFPSWKHWNKNDELLTSGLLGPVKLHVFQKIIIDND